MMNFKIFLFVLGILFIHGQTVNAQCAAGALDSDLDGVCDILDQDDDNDGILDVNEWESSVIAPHSTNPNYINSGYYPGLNSPQMSSPTSWSTPAANNTHYVGMLLDVPGRLISVSTKGRGNYDQWVTTYLLEGTKDGTNWQAIGTYNANTNRDSTVINTISNTDNDWLGIRINPQTWLGHPSMRFEIEVAYNDFDKDGIINSLDSDSDNDLCGDAFEGSAALSINNINGSGAITGGVDMNAGSPNYGVPLAVGTGQQKGTAFNKDNLPDSRECLCIAANDQTDTDNDGICNLADLDDDNDGIPDDQEKFCAVSPLDSYSYYGNADSIVLEDLILLTARSGWQGSYSNETLKLPIHLSFTAPSGVNFMIGFLPLNSIEKIDNWNDSAYKIHLNPSYGYGKFPNAWDIAQISYELDDIFELKIELDGTLTMLQNANLLYTGMAPITDYKLVINSGNSGIIKNINLKQDIENCPYMDTDNDGQPDYLDLDSDNDGCPDAAEGSGGFTLNDMTGTGALTGNIDNVSSSQTYGVPLIAGTGQEINLSQTADELPNDVSCLCVAANNPQDSDNDGTCDEIDNCANFDDALIGTPCNDNDACTENDIWLNSCECKGTLTSAACGHSPLMISEIMYHPQELDSLYPLYEDREDAEFLEIWNSGTSSIDVSNYTLDGVSYCFPPGTILSPDQRVVLTKDATIFQNVFGLTPFDVYEGKLSNSGEKIQLFDNEGIKLQTVDYSDHHLWPTIADGMGHSIELVSAYGDTEAYHNWFASKHPDGHTAGTPNSIHLFGDYPGIDSIRVDDTQPDPGQVVNITAWVVGATSISLEYRINFGITQSITANISNGVANFTLPAFTADDIIHYVVKAHNLVGTFTMPRVDDTMPAYAFIVNDPNRSPSNFPVLNWYYDSFTANDEYTTLEYNGSAITNTYSWWRRGKHWRLEFPKGHKFEMPGFSTMPISDLQLNRPDHGFSWWVNGTMARTTVYTDIISEQGEPKMDAFNVRVDENGEWGKIWTYLSWPNGDWREAVGIDDGHEYYKFPSTEVTGTPNPEIKHPEGGSDEAVWEALLLKDSTEAILMDLYDIPRMVNFMALSTIICHWDAGLKNFYMHRHPNGRWEGDIWDVDASPRTGIDSIEVDWCKCGEMPRQGDLTRPDGSFVPGPLFGENGNSGNTFAVPLLETSPRVKAMYHRRIRTLIDIYFAPGELIGRVLEEANPTDPDIDSTANLYAIQFEGSGYLNDITETQQNIYVHYPEWQLATYDTLSGFPASATGLTDIVINEIQYAPGGGDQEEFIELYNNNNESVDISNWELEGVGLTFPYGTVILPNDFLVVASWSPSFIDKYGSGKYVAADFEDARLNNSGETIRLLKPDGTIEDEVTYEQTGWKQAHGGPSLERINSNAPSDDPANWAPSAAPFGTPDAPNNADTNADYPPVAMLSDIIINEIMYHSDTLNGLSGANLDFIEIRNNESTPVDISGIQIKGIDYTFSDQTILQPNEIIVIAADIHAFNIKYGFMPFDVYDGKLENNGETIEIISTTGYSIDKVTFDDKNPWDEAPDGTGYSLELLNPLFDNTDILNWFRSDNTGGTPGEENSRICNATASPIVINEINYNSNNDGFDPGDWVELYNPNSTAVDISGWTFYDNTNDFIIPSGTSIAPNDFLIIVEDENMFGTSFPHLNNDQFLGDFVFGLSNKGERVSLFNEDKCLSDYVVFDDKLPWDTIPDGNGPTLSLITTDLDNVLPESWEASSNINSAYGTPGRPNTPCPESYIIAPSTVCAGFPVSIAVDSIYPRMELTWSLFGATPSFINADNIEPVWSTPGTYNIQLISSYFECTKIYTQQITVEACNGAPIALDDNFITIEDTPLSDNINNNDSDPDNDALIWNTTPIIPPANGSLSLNTDGTFTYTPNPGFIGNDSFEYEVCDVSDYSPPYTFTQRVRAGSDDVEELSTDGSINFGSGDLDLMDDDGTVYSAVGIRMTNIHIPQNAVITDAYLEFVADENNNEATSLNIMAEASGNAAPIPNTTFALSNKIKTAASANWSNVPVWTAGNTYISEDISPVVQEIINRADWQSGNAMTFIIQGTGTRTPETFEGGASVAPKLIVNYQLSNNLIDISLCDQAVVNIEVELGCVDFDLSVFLEGPFNPSTGEMISDLNLLRGLLPGQTPGSALTSPTPSGQPYNINPWNYSGTEGIDWTDANYDDNAIDWILVSTRTELDKNTQVGIAAGILNKDGSIDFQEGCPLESIGLDSVYIIIEHRNHMGIMTPQKVPVINNSLSWDFRYSDSYKDVTSYGQKEILPGTWVMFAGDGDQSDFPSFDIKGTDKTLWLDNNGIFQQYEISDFDLNGDVNGADKVLWFENNGVSSRVPK